MPVTFPHASPKPYTVADDLFSAAWALWFDRYQPILDPKTDTMPRLNQAVGLADQLKARKHFSLDVLCRMLVTPSYRNTMHATPPFMNANAHLLEDVRAINPNGKKEVNSARLTQNAIQRLIHLQGDHETWTDLKSQVEALLDADIEVKEANQITLCEAGLEVENLPSVEVCHAPVSLISSLSGLVKTLVDWIQQDPFQPMYRGRPYGTPVTGWDQRLLSYFWPNPSMDFGATLSQLSPLLSNASTLMGTLPPLSASTVGTKWATDAEKWDQEVFIWGGVPQSIFTGDDVRDVLHNALHPGSRSCAKMNSGWTKVAAFATAHLALAQQLVIWDSRVSHSLIKRIDALLSNNGHHHIPAYLANIGRVPGRGGSRLTSGYTLAWPNGYQRWSSVFLGSELVREICKELNSRNIPLPEVEGVTGNWTVRLVEMVLFMDGY